MAVQHIQTLLMATDQVVAGILPVGLVRPCVQ